MNAVDEIQAAIEKLTALKAGSTPGTWDYSLGANITSEARGEQLSLFSPHEDHCNGKGVPSDDCVADAALIVTLHATIDAQIGVLTRAYNMAVTGREVVTVVEMNLARAINGGPK